ncbi:MAG: hypothetical protein SFU86_03005 [Pirellulaceae bacterium]|nr:hypothetical protein [Pirellulaceae bacterium]
MSEFHAGSAPGFAAKVESEEKNVLWAGRHGQDLAATRKINLVSSATDSGNTPQTTLRAGLVLAIDPTTGKANTYSPDANDGRQIAVGILERSQDMLVDGVATERFTQMLVHGLVKQGELLNLDARARQQLGQRMTFDGELSPQAGVLMHPRGVYRKSTSYSVSADDNGLLFLATAAATFTLPTKANGLAFRFAQTADANLVISGSSDLIHKGNAGASSITFGTTGEKIGSQVLVECVYTAAGTLRWLVTNLGGTTATVA